MHQIHTPDVTDFEKTQTPSMHSGCGARAVASGPSLPSVPSSLREEGRGPSWWAVSSLPWAPALGLGVTGRPRDPQQPERRVLATPSAPALSLWLPEARGEERRGL